MTELTAQGKFIDTASIKTLLTQGERYADKIRITLSTINNETDISGCTFTMRTVAFDGSMTEAILTKEVAEGFVNLIWIPDEQTTAVAGVLFPELIGSVTDQIIIKYKMPPIYIKEAVMGSNVPAPDIVEAKLAQMNAILERAEELYGQFDNDTGVIQEVINARTPTIFNGSCTSLTDRLNKDFALCITQSGLESALRNVTTAYTNADEKLKLDIAVNQASIGLQRKNLFFHAPISSDFYYYTNHFDENGVYAVNGVTFTKNQDGSVTVNGTATLGSCITLFADRPPKTWQKYPVILTGCPENTNPSDPDYRLTIEKEIFGTNVWTEYNDKGSGTNAVSFNEQNAAAVRIYVKAGVAFNNVVFYPMLRYADIEDDTFEPYIPDMQTQVESNDEDIAMLKAAVGMTSKNIFSPVSISERTSNGVTHSSVQGFFSASGTTTGSFTVYLLSESITVDKDIIISGAKTLSNLTYMAKITDASGTTSYKSIGTAGLEVKAGDTVSAVYVQQQSADKTVSSSIYLMARYKEISDDSFETYKQSLLKRITAIETRLSAMEAYSSGTLSTNSSAVVSPDIILPDAEISGEESSEVQLT